MCHVVPVNNSCSTQSSPQYQPPQLERRTARPEDHSLQLPAVGRTDHKQHKKVLHLWPITASQCGRIVVERQTTDPSDELREKEPSVSY